MNWIRITTLAAVLLLALAAPAFAEVRWTTDDWETVLERARTENKYVYVDFFTVWCGPCKEMDKTTYVDDRVVEFLSEKTIAVKLNGEEGRGKDLVETYRVTFYPTQIVIGPDGEEIDRYLGMLTPDEFMTTIVGYTRGEGTWRAMERELAERPNDMDLLLALGTKHVDAVRHEKAIECLERYMALDPEDETGRRAEITYQLGELAYMAKDYAESKRFFEQLLAENPEGDWRARGLHRLPYTLHKLGETEAAISTYLEFVNLDPDDPKKLNAFAWFCAQRQIGLDEALPIAIKAVEVSDRDPGILDTLAELYYARGDFDKAIEIGKEALESDPEDEYFINQVKKYRKAKEEAGSQARG